MRIAARQWGVLTRQQALKSGLTRNQIACRVQTGQWLQPVRGVFIIAGVPKSWEQSLMIACLAGPADTTASHLSAAALFGLAKPPEVPHVTIPPRGSGRFKGAVVFEGRWDPATLARAGGSAAPTPAGQSWTARPPAWSAERPSGIWWIARCARS
jgi:hypothetical protein